MYKVAVIGLGVGEQHARYYRDHVECDLVMLCDYDLDKATTAAKEYGCSIVTDSWKDVFQNPEIDIVSIASFDHHHAEQLIAALSSGKHVFVEKPLCTLRKELNDIVPAWKGSGVSLVSNLPLRTAPLFRWLKDAISKGDLGEIYAIDGEYLYGRVDKITKGWRKDIDDYSVIEGGGIHMLDLMLFLTEQYPSQVTSIGNKIVTKGTDFQYDDYAVSTFEFDSGLIARLSSNFGCVHPHQHVLKVFGTKATFILDDMGSRIQYKRDPLNSDDYQKNKDIKKPKAEFLDYAAKPESKAELIDDLVDAIRTKDSSGLTLHEFRLMNACLSAAESLKSGKTEEIGIIYE